MQSHLPLVPLIATTALACVLALPSDAQAQTTPEIIVTGQYSGEIRCDANPRAELITLAETGQTRLVRVRSYPVSGGPYFQWHDALYEMEDQGDGQLVSTRGAYIRGIAGQADAPVDMHLTLSADGTTVTRADAGGLCGGSLTAISDGLAALEAFPDALQGAISHLTLDRRSFERITDRISPTSFPVEILLTADPFGSFATLRLDQQERTCLYHAAPAGGMQIRRQVLHAALNGQGGCTDGDVTYQERGPVLMMTWDGSYRQGAVTLAAQENRLAAFLSTLGAAPGSFAEGAAAGLPPIPGAIIPTADRPAEFPGAFAGMDWEIRGVPLGLDLQTTMAMAAPGQALELDDWGYETGTVLNPPERRPQYGPQRIQLSTRTVHRAGSMMSSTSSPPIGTRARWSTPSTARSALGIWSGCPRSRRCWPQSPNVMASPPIPAGSPMARAASARRRFGG